MPHTKGKVIPKPASTTSKKTKSATKFHRVMLLFTSPQGLIGIGPSCSNSQPLRKDSSSLKYSLTPFFSTSSLTAILIFLLLTTYFLVFSNSWTVSNNFNYLHSNNKYLRSSFYFTSWHWIAPVSANSLSYNHIVDDDDEDNNEKCYGKEPTDPDACSGNGRCVAKNTCDCYVGYYGNKCNSLYTCGSLTQQSPLVCSGRGNCTGDNSCTCSNGYSGSLCEGFSCFSVSYSNSSVCSRRGNCTNLDVCSCAEGYYGRNCELTSCFSFASNHSGVCRGNGICTSYNNCTCNPGYYDPLCSSFSCFSVPHTSSSACSGKGNCTKLDVCSCVEGYYGSNCGLTSCFGLPSNMSQVCQGNGVCNNYNNCTCANNSHGIDCGILEIAGENVVLSLSDSSVLETQSNNSLVTVSFLDFKFKSYYNTKNSLTITFIIQSGNYSFSENTTALTWRLPSLTVGEYTIRVVIIDRNYDIIVGSNSQLIPLSVYTLKQVTDNPSNIKGLDIISLNQVANNLQNITNKTEIIEAIATTLTNKTSNITSEESLFLSKTLLIITDSSYVSYLTEMGKEAISETINKFSDSVVSSSSTTSVSVNAIATNLLLVASNIVDIRISSETSQKAIDSSLSAISISNKNEGNKDQIKVVTKNFVALVVLNENGGMNSIDTNHSVTIPSSIANTLGASITGFGMVRYGHLPETVNQFSDDSISFSVAKVLQFKTLVNGMYVPLKNLKENITLTFTIDESSINQTLINSTLANNSSAQITKKYVCRYWNETEMKWLQNGCSSSYDNGIISCSCDHTTRFSAFIDFTSPPYKNNDRRIQYSLSVASIAVSSIFLIMIAVVFILLIVLRKTQPVKSRYISPHLALGSLFIENLVVGLISKSLLLRFHNSPDFRLDLMIDICTVISTAMRAAAIWCYMVMSLRYLVHRYFYEWMMKALETNKKDSLIKYLNILKKQSILVLSSIVTGFIFLVYFSIFVILRGEKSLSGAQFSTAATASLFILLMLMTCIIVAIYIIDLILERSNKQMSDEIVDIAEEMNTLVEPSMSEDSKDPSKKYSTKFSHELAKGSQLLRSIFKTFVSNDVLMFRTEVLFYLVGMLFFSVSYLIGFATLDIRFSNDQLNNTTVDTMDSVIFLFETLMTLFLIIAFGGFAVCWALKTESTKRGLFAKKQLPNSFREFEEKHEVLSLKQNKYLLKLFRQYTKTEMSLENYIIWIRLEKFKQDYANLLSPSNSNTEGWDALVSEIDEIYRAHIVSTSEMSVNIGSPTTKKFLVAHNALMNTNITTLDGSQVAELKTITNEVIMDLMTDIVYNLMDTYSRFVITEEYKIVKEVQICREMTTVQLFK